MQGLVAELALLGVGLAADVLGDRLALVSPVTCIVDINNISWYGESAVQHVPLLIRVL